MNVESEPVNLRGSFRLNLPGAVLLSVLSALGARTLPTHTGTDERIEKVEASIAKLELAEERRFEEQQRADSARDSRIDGIEAKVTALWRAGDSR